jgi:hypothetical protein
MNLKIGQLDDHEDGNTSQAARTAIDSHNINHSRWEKGYALLTSKLKGKKIKRQLTKSQPSSQAAEPSSSSAKRMENDKKDGVEVFRVSEWLGTTGQLLQITMPTCLVLTNYASTPCRHTMRSLYQQQIPKHWNLGED